MKFIKKCLMVFGAICALLFLIGVFADDEEGYSEDEEYGYEDDYWSDEYYEDANERGSNIPNTKPVRSNNGGRNSRSTLSFDK